MAQKEHEIAVKRAKLETRKKEQQEVAFRKAEKAQSEIRDRSIICLQKMGK